MRKLLTAALMLSLTSVATIAIAQDKPFKPDESGVVQIAQAGPVMATDARSVASDQDIGQARRAYRAACDRHQSAGFCECVTAGVAQALMPQEVRIAARTIGERINAQGDAFAASESDVTNGANSQDRIAQVEAHYADACAQFRN